MANAIMGYIRYTHKHINEVYNNHDLVVRAHFFFCTILELGFFFANFFIFNEKTNSTFPMDLRWPLNYKVNKTLILNLMDCSQVSQRYSLTSDSIILYKTQIKANIITTTCFVCKWNIVNVRNIRNILLDFLAI